MQEVMEACVRTNVNRDSAKPVTIGMMWEVGGDKNRVEMTNDERDNANDSQALTRVAKYRALVALISVLSQDRPNLKSCGNAAEFVVRWQLVRLWLGMGQEDWKVLSWRSREQRDCSAGNSVVILKRIWTQIGEATKSPGCRWQLV